MVNHEYNFMKQIIQAKKNIGSTLIMFEWSIETNRYASDVVECAWMGYVMAVKHLTGEDIG